MKFGYARVSTKDQSFDSQDDALKAYGCERIFKEVASGAKQDRQALTQLLALLRAGDTVVVWKLDRLGRSLRHLIEIINLFIEKNVGFVSLQDPIDTTTAQGRLIFNIFSSLAEFERELIRERTQAGLASARARGRLGGRPKGLSEKAQALACASETLYLEKKLSVQQIADKLGISKKTLYRYLKSRKVAVGGYGKNKK